MAEDSDLERTEPASARRLQQARDDGNVPQSRELSTFLVLIAGVAGLWVSWRWMLDHLHQVLLSALSVQRAHVFDTGMMLSMLFDASRDGLIAMAPLFVLLAIAAIGAPTLLGGWIFSFKAFELDLTRLSPLRGIGRMFSLHGLVELIKSLLKAVIILGIGVWLMLRHLPAMQALSTLTLEQALAELGSMLLWGSLALVGGLALLALIDVPFQLWQYYDRLKMTKEELKQEYKEQEGDPLVKGQIRARQREMARRRMMEAVPKADVVVTNPTHFAVALKYEADRMGAPTVVAKGADLVAHNIRELAREHNVPLLEAPPLARALYRHAEVGAQIPAALYTAVAEVMAYIYQLNAFLSGSGLPPEAPHDIAVPAGMDPQPQ